MTTDYEPIRSTKRLKVGDEIFITSWSQWGRNDDYVLATVCKVGAVICVSYRRPTKNNFPIVGDAYRVMMPAEFKRVAYRRVDTELAAA